MNFLETSESRSNDKLIANAGKINRAIVAQTVCCKYDVYLYISVQVRLPDVRRILGPTTGPEPTHQAVPFAEQAKRSLYIYSLCLFFIHFS